MSEIDLEQAFNNTKILRLPRQKIFTFWETNFQYHIVSPHETEGTSLVSHGDFQCSRPMIVSGQEPLEKRFSGFDEQAQIFARSSYEDLAYRLIQLGYSFKNNFKIEEQVHLTNKETLKNLLQDSSIDKQNSAILYTQAGYEHIGLMRAAFEMILRSAPNNISQMQERGMFASQEERIHSEIEILFYEAENLGMNKKVLGKKLQEYGVFEQYEERFLRLFK